MFPQPQGEFNLLWFMFLLLEVNMVSQMVFFLKIIIFIATRRLKGFLQGWLLGQDDTFLGEG